MAKLVDYSSTSEEEEELPDSTCFPNSLTKAKPIAMIESLVMKGKNLAATRPKRPCLVCGKTISISNWSSHKNLHAVPSEVVVRNIRPTRLCLSCGKSISISNWSKHMKWHQNQQALPIIQSLNNYAKKPKVLMDITNLSQSTATLPTVIGNIQKVDIRDEAEVIHHRDIVLSNACQDTDSYTLKVEDSAKQLQILACSEDNLSNVGFPIENSSVSLPKVNEENGNTFACFELAQEANCLQALINEFHANIPTEAIQIGDILLLQQCEILLEKDEILKSINVNAPINPPFVPRRISPNLFETDNVFIEADDIPGNQAHYAALLKEQFGASEKDENLTTIPAQSSTEENENNHDSSDIFRDVESDPSCPILTGNYIQKPVGTTSTDNHLVYHVMTEAEQFEESQENENLTLLSTQSSTECNGTKIEYPSNSTKDFDCNLDSSKWKIKRVPIKCITGDTLSKHSAQLVNVEKIVSLDDVQAESIQEGKSLIQNENVHVLNSDTEIEITLEYESKFERENGEMSLYGSFNVGTVSNRKIHEFRNSEELPVGRKISFDVTPPKRFKLNDAQSVMMMPQSSNKDNCSNMQYSSNLIKDLENDLSPITEATTEENHDTDVTYVGTYQFPDHYIQKISTNKWKCLNCGIIITEKRKLRKHLTVSTDCVRLRTIKCEFCRSSFSTKTFSSHPCTHKSGRLKLNTCFVTNDVLPFENYVPDKDNYFSIGEHLVRNTANQFSCSFCNTIFSDVHTLKRHFLKSNCITIRFFKCERCGTISKKEAFGEHNCKQIDNQMCLGQYECICGECVAYCYHFCTPLKKIFDKFGLQQPIHRKKILSNNKVDFDLQIVYEFANELLTTNNLFLMRCGCALLMSYKFLVRTSKGNLDATRTQSVWTLQKEHFTIDSRTLNLQCVYMVSAFNRSFDITQLEENAFHMILENTKGKYIFSGTKTFVNSFVRAKFKVDLYAARQAAISSFFWKILALNKELLPYEKRIEYVMHQLSILTNHTLNEEFTEKVNKESYLDKKTEEIALNYLNGKGDKLNYNLHFELPTFTDFSDQIFLQK